MEYILLVVIGYLCGNINFATIIAKRNNIKIREVGSHNPGASNITINLGFKYGILTAVLDILKAFIPVLIVRLLNYDEFTIVSVGVAAVVGHIYPVFYRFKGGKGTASFVGFLLALNPILGFCMTIGLIALTFITDFIAIATYIGMMSFIVYAFLTMEINSFLIALVVPLISFYKHRENLIKIYNKEESRLSALFKKK